MDLGGHSVDPTCPANPSGEAAGHSTPEEGESRRMGQPSANGSTHNQSAPVAGQLTSRLEGPSNSAQGVAESTDRSPTCPHCGKVFKSFAGRRLHERRAHALDFHEGAIKRLEDRRNKPWAPEELNLMAQFEVSNLGHPFINAKIQECVLNERSVNSISGKRKSKQYQDLLKNAKGKEEEECKVVKPKMIVEPTGASQESHVGGRLDWTSDDEISMIKFEVDNKDDHHINKSIVQRVFPWRTLESVRTKRKTLKYRHKVAAYAEHLKTLASAVPPTLSRVRMDGTRSAATENLRVTSVADEGLAYASKDTSGDQRRSTVAPKEVNPVLTTPIMTRNTASTLITLQATHENSKSQDGMNEYLDRSRGGRDSGPLTVDTATTSPLARIGSQTSGPALDRGRAGHGPSSGVEVVTTSALAPGGSPPSSPDGSDASPLSKRSLSTSGENEISQEIDSLKEEIFGSRPRVVRANNNSRGCRQLQGNIPRNIRRRREYAAIQRGWDKNRSRVAQNAILGKDPLASPTFPPGTVEYWTALFGRPSPASLLNDEAQRHSCTILEPINTLDIEWCKRKTSLKMSPGPDGIRAADFRAAANYRIAELYNTILQSKTATYDWARGRTTLLPKKDVPQEAGDFRPITITSVLTRGLHKILSKRLAERIPSSVCQKGFKAGEGVSSNLLLLQELIKEAKTESKTLYLVFIDFKKAFDSVSHHALLDTLRAAGLDNDSIHYLTNFYSSISTEVAGIWVNITRGVMQGDPLSPCSSILP
ncbi:uncharacterized protein [Palaemon carinicauda]|uniref:uncharacterized protein n=1 Tax=Palaemon carinicauda TaxID=392227 RepID=UPI0035B5B714